MKEQGFLKNHRKSLKRLFNPYINPYNAYTPYSGLEKMIDLADFSSGSEEEVVDGYDDGTSTDGAISFATSYLSLPAGENWSLGTGAFTISWWQYQLPGAAYARIFTVGNWPTPTFAVSIEANGATQQSQPCDFCVWIGNEAVIYTQTTTLHRWHYFTIIRDVLGQIHALKDGQELEGYTTTPYNLTDITHPLLIGTDTSDVRTYFSGYITNFEWIKGQSMFHAPPFARKVPQAGTKLLLLSIDEAGLITDSSASPQTVTNNGCTFIQKTPLNT